MTEFLGVAGFGSVFLLVSVLSYRDLLPRRHDREGIYDNLYTAWVLGCSMFLLGLMGLAPEDPGPVWSLLTVLWLASVVYGIYAVVASPRWMWPAWRREMERRQQAEQEDRG